MHTLADTGAACATGNQRRELPGVPQLSGDLGPPPLPPHGARGATLPRGLRAFLLGLRGRTTRLVAMATPAPPPPRPPRILTPLPHEADAGEGVGCLALSSPYP